MQTSPRKPFVLVKSSLQQNPWNFHNRLRDVWKEIRGNLWKPSQSYFCKLENVLRRDKRGDSLYVILFVFLEIILFGICFVHEQRIYDICGILRIVFFLRNFWHRKNCLHRLQSQRSYFLINRLKRREVNKSVFVSCYSNAVKSETKYV